MNKNCDQFYWPLLCLHNVHFFSLRQIKCFFRSWTCYFAVVCRCHRLKSLSRERERSDVQQQRSMLHSLWNHKRNHSVTSTVDYFHWSVHAIEHRSILTPNNGRRATLWRWSSNERYKRDNSDFSPMKLYQNKFWKEIEVEERRVASVSRSYGVFKADKPLCKMAVNLLCWPIWFSLNKSRRNWSIKRVQRFSSNKAFQTFDQSLSIESHRRQIAFTW